jgi:histidine triad (HIT) family protein
VTDCLFCKIAKGEIPCHKVWEDEKHVAFLSIFPVMRGFTVLMPTQHFPSNVQELPDARYTALCLAAKKVAKRLSKALAVDRCAIIAEGTGVDHAHLKLIPLIGLTPGAPFPSHHVEAPKPFERYEGYLTTLEGPRADDGELAALAKLIREHGD